MQIARVGTLLIYYDELKDIKVEVTLLQLLMKNGNDIWELRIVPIFFLNQELFNPFASAPRSTKTKKGRPFDLPFQYPLRGSNPGPQH